MSEKAPKIRGSIYASFVAMCIGYLFALVPRLALAINADNIARDFNLAPAALGILASAYFCTYALTQAPSGALADRMAPEILIMGSLIGVSLANMMFVFAPSFNVAILSRLVTGLTGSLVYVPALKFTAAQFPHNFSFYTGIFGSINGLCAIMVNGPLVTLSEQYGWRSVFVLSAAVSLVTAAVLFFLYRLNRQTAALEPSLITAPGPGKPEAPKAGLKEAFQNRLAWPMFFRIFISSGVHMSFTSLWAGPYMMQVLNMSRAQAGGTLAIMSTASLFIGPLGGYLADNVVKTRRLMVSLGLVWFALCWLPLVFFTDSLSPLFLTVTLSAMSLQGIGIGAQLAQVKEVYPPETVGAAMGVNNTFLILGCAVMPTLFGMVIGSAGAGADPTRQFRLVFIINIVLLALAAIASFSSVETYGKTYEEIVAARSLRKHSKSNAI